MILHPFKVLMIALAAVLGLGTYLAYRETVSVFRSAELTSIACAPAEPPVSRLGCAP